MLYGPHRKFEVGNLLQDIPKPYPGKIPVPYSALDGFPTAHASANTKGNWASMYDPLPYDISGFLFQLVATASFRDYLIDFGIGPSGGGSEVVVIPNLLFSATPLGVQDTSVYIPLCIPGSAGKRLSMRIQCSTGSSTLVSYGYVFSETIRYPRLLSVETFGAVTADSGGTSIDPGATPNTNGVFSTLGTTTNRIREVIVVAGNQNNNARSNTAWRPSIAIGASDTVIIQYLRFTSSTSNDMVSPAVVGPIPVDIPPGTAIKAQAQSGTTDATDRLLDLVVYGLSESA